MASIEDRLRRVFCTRLDGRTNSHSMLDKVLTSLAVFPSLSSHMSICQ